MVCRLILLCVITATVEACGREYSPTVVRLYENGLNEVITPLYPGSYPDNEDCHWLVKAPVGGTIGYCFSTDSELEPDSSNLCRYDNVTLYESSSTIRSSAIVGRFCGEYGDNIPDGPRMTSGNNLLIVFKSDKSKAMRGFKISLKEGSLPCCKRPSTEDRSATIGAIVGGVLGSLLLICCVCCCCCCCKSMTPEDRERQEEVRARFRAALRAINPDLESGMPCELRADPFKPPPYAEPPMYATIFPTTEANQSEGTSVNVSGTAEEVDVAAASVAGPAVLELPNVHENTRL